MTQQIYTSKDKSNIKSTTLSSTKQILTKLVKGKNKLNIQLFKHRLKLNRAIGWHTISKNIPQIGDKKYYFFHVKRFYKMKVRLSKSTLSARFHKSAQLRTLYRLNKRKRVSKVINKRLLISGDYNKSNKLIAKRLQKLQQYIKFNTKWSSRFKNKSQIKSRFLETLYISKLVATRFIKIKPNLKINVKKNRFKTKGLFLKNLYASKILPTLKFSKFISDWARILLYICLKHKKQSIITVKTIWKLLQYKKSKSTINLLSGLKRFIKYSVKHKRIFNKRMLHTISLALSKGYEQHKKHINKKQAKSKLISLLPKASKRVIKNYHLRELTNYHYHNKLKKRKREFSLYSKILPFWKKLTQGSKYYNRGQFLPLASKKLKILSQYSSQKDKKRYLNFQVHTIDLLKFKTIKIRFKKYNISRAIWSEDRNFSEGKKAIFGQIVHINISHNTLLNKNIYQPWFTAIKNDKNKYAIMMLVDPSNRLIHYINTAKVTVVYLHINSSKDVINNNTNNTNNRNKLLLLRKHITKRIKYNNKLKPVQNRKNSLLLRKIRRRFRIPAKWKRQNKIKIYNINAKSLKLWNTHFIKFWTNSNNHITNNPKKNKRLFNRYQLAKFKASKFYNKNEYIFNKQIPSLSIGKKYLKKVSIKAHMERNARKKLSSFFLAKRKRSVRKLTSRYYRRLISKWSIHFNKLQNNSNIEILQRVWLKKLFTSTGKNKVNSLLVNKNKDRIIINKLWKRVEYKFKWYNYYEFRSFRWKFYKKRWYFAMSRWKRLLAFKRLMRKAWNNYRKINKNEIFIKLLRANFYYILGITEADLLNKWSRIRRGNNTNDSQSTVGQLNQMLQLKIDGLAMFLGLAPNRLMAQEFVRCGGMRINGLVVTDQNYSMAHKDMLQIDLKINDIIRPLYNQAHWNAVRARLKFTQFIQIVWPIMLFMMVRWPHDYELLEESILNQRWLRFFIRYFPVRIAKYKKAKIKWHKY
jgi:hypothetical protein